MDYAKLIEDLAPVARLAGEAIMKVYHRGVTAETKSDGSPVTLADERAEAIILDGLAKHAPQITVVSEENADSHRIRPPEQYFLVDPLDGTKEFLKADGAGAFTVNIALIENGTPVLGIIYAPALNRMFAGAAKLGASENGNPINIRAIPEQGPVAVASVSHRDEETDAWLAERRISQTNSVGSSLKFCLIASGEADVYPRFGPTMEWDTAAGDAILRAAGGRVEHIDGQIYTYGKPEFRNVPFVAYGTYRD